MFIKLHEITCVSIGKTLITLVCMIALLNELPILAKQVQDDKTAEQSASDDKSQQIEKLLRDLDSSSFADRQTAMIELASMGEIVIDPLSDRTRTASVEFQNRAMSVLHRLAVVSEVGSSEKAIAAIRKLSQSDSRSVAARAAKALDQLAPLIQARLEKQLENKNIAFYRSPYANRNGNSPITGIAYTEKWQYEKADLDVISAFPNLIAVTLDHPQITNDDFLNVIQAANVKKIAIRQAKIDNQAFENVSQKTGLQRLDIYYCNLNDDVVQQFVKCKNLTTLKLIGTKVTDEGAKALRKNRPEEFLDYRKGGYLGVRYNRGSDSALLTGIEPNSAAEKAGLKINDTIISYNGNKIEKPEDLSRFISPASIKDEALIIVKRGDKELEFKVKLGRWDMPDIDEFVNQIR